MHKEADDNQTRKWVWIPQAHHSFIPAYIHSADDDMAVVITQDNQKITLPANQLYRMNPSKFNMAEDLALLSYLNEPSVLHNLRQRYEQDFIYTYSGLFLLAINPYKEIFELYDNKTILKYKERTTQSRNYVNSDNLQPHIFAVANDAYNSMIMNQENQSILITGESGAGKTENTKKVINFLAHIASNTETDVSSSIEENMSNVSLKVLETNRLLESFGNAQTIKNDNSSRFGKFIKIEFCKGKITGAYIEKYLLEKSRVTRVNKNERNYHIFYQLIQAIYKNKKKAKQSNVTNAMFMYETFLDELRVSLRFSEDVKLSDFHYLKNTNKKIDNVDDADDFYKLCQSMDVLEFTNEEKIGIFKIISTILHLGNLKFKEENEQAEIENFETVQIICDLLKINQNHFVTSLLTPITRAGNENVVYSRNKEQVINIVEALSRLLYERMFDSIISKVNLVLGKNTYFEKRNTNFIGVLDIAGFEIFHKNDFEQFCINFTNEKLQQFFNHHMFILEQEIYKKENINWKFIDFGLNLQPTIDIIEKSNPIGILSYLDEECVMPKGSDLTFLEKLREIETSRGRSNSDHSKYSDIVNNKRENVRGYKRGAIVDEYNNYCEDLQMNGACKNSERKIFHLSKLAHSFVIEHYAGKVEYIVEDWLKKNKDPHFDYLTTLLKQSTDEYVQTLFTFDSHGKKGFFRTVSQKHKDSLNLLMEQLKKTNPYFVRCIIPNNEKKSNFLLNGLVLHQLKCNGVMEGIRISRQGYPTRMLFKEFKRRYQILGKRNEEFEDNKEACISILEIALGAHTKYNYSETKVSELNANLDAPYKLGNTMIFFRQGVLAEIEDLREVKLNEISSVMQGLIRKRLTIKKYNLQKIRSSAIKVIQKNGRLSNNFMQWNWWRLYLKIKPLLEITKMDSEIKIRDERLERMNLEMMNVKETNEEYKKKIESIIKENKGLENELENGRNILNEREELINGLRKECERIEEKKLEQANKELMKSVEEENARVKMESEKVREENVKVKAENEKVKAKIDNIKNEELIMKVELERLNNEGKITKTELEKVKKEGLSMQADFERLKTEYEKVKDECERVKKESLNVKADYTSIKDECESIKSKNEYLKAECERRESEREEMQEKCKSLEEEIESIKKVLNEKVKVLYKRLNESIKKYKEEESIKTKPVLRNDSNSTFNAACSVCFSLEDILECNKKLEEILKNSENEIEELKRNENEIKKMNDKNNFENKNKIKELLKKNEKNENLIKNLEEKLKIYKNELNKKNENIENGIIYFVKEGCTFMECKCVEKEREEENENHRSIVLCRRDYGTLKLIKELKFSLENEKEKCEFLRKENERIEFLCKNISSDFEFIVKVEKENKVKNIKLINEKNVMKNNLEMKNKEIYFMKNEIQNMKNEIQNLMYEIEVNENIIQNISNKAFEKQETVLNDFNDMSMKRKVIESENKVKEIKNELERYKNKVNELEMKMNIEKMKVVQLENEVEDKTIICDTLIKKGVCN